MDEEAILANALKTNHNQTQREPEQLTCCCRHRDSVQGSQQQKVKSQ